MSSRRNIQQDFTTNVDHQLPIIIPSSPNKGNGYPPVFAYWIRGTQGDSKRIMRLLQTIYHPRNQYLLQLDAGSSDYERAELALAVQGEKVFNAYGNVNVMGKAYAVDEMGSSALAATLHAAAMLLKISADWDWFIALSPSDYPLVTQDELLYAFTFLPRNLSFVDFTNKSGWKERQEINRIVIDPNLYYTKNTPIFYAIEPRPAPDAFKIYGGSPWMILTKAFMEYCIHGWDNSPRKLAMYFSNIPYPLDSYFQTVICDSTEFRSTTLNNNLHYDTTLNSPELKILEMSPYHQIFSSEAIFARAFQENDPTLDIIDKNILNRPSSTTFPPGKWCSKIDEEFTSDIDAVEPGRYGSRLKVTLSELTVDGVLQSEFVKSRGEHRRNSRDRGLPPPLLLFPLSSVSVLPRWVCVESRCDGGVGGYGRGEMVMVYGGSMRSSKR
ncbi:hypothetical protein ACFE04_031770 [Oxalis oulophora]